MYCPPAAMSAKIVAVRVRVNESLKELNQFEARQLDLTGGHLEAQELRFL